VALILAMLAFAVALGLIVDRVGLKVYVSLFVFSSVTSVAFIFLYWQLFL
jgi:hypothetical protein